MRSSWSFVHLVRRSAVSGDVLRHVIEEIQRPGIPFLRDAEGNILCFSGQGDAVFQWRTLEDVVAWLAESDGLVPFLIDGGPELSISVDRVPLAPVGTTAPLPDEAVYDVVTLDVAGFLGWQDEPGRIGLRSLLAAIAPALGAVFVHAWDDDSFEATIDRQCVHERISRGLLPPFVPWLSMVPRTSLLAARLRSRAAVLTRPLDDLGLYTGLRLTQELPPSAAAVVLEASAVVRDSEHDSGC